MAKNFGRYEIIDTIGQGMVSTVLKAFDPSVNRHIAIKILRDEYSVNPETLALFLRESKAVGKLTHTNIVTIYDVGEIDDRPYIAMELLSGQFLDDVMIAGTQFSWQEVVEIAKQMASALEYAHRHGVIHTDIKPGNIAWIADEKRIVLTDFGAAFHNNLDQNASLSLQQTVKSPRYMSPEQVMGNVLDERSDLYSIGVVLYQLLTGHRPIGTDTLNSLTGHTTKQQPRFVSTYVSGIYGSFVKIIDKLLEKSPDRRMQTCAELYSELEALSRHLAIHIARKRIRSRKYLVGGAVAMASVLLLILIGNFILIDRSSQGEDDTAVIDDADTGEKSSEDILVASIEQRLTQFECSNLAVKRAQDESISITGHVSFEEDMMSIMDVMEAIQGVSNVSYEVNIMPWPYCVVASMISSEKNVNVSHESGLQLTTSDAVVELMQGSNLKLEVMSPDYDAYIYVDYYRSDGKVIHLYPGSSNSGKLTPAASGLLIGNGFKKWRIKRPFGENMLVVMASYNPLVPMRDHFSEPAEDYLALLHRQIVVNRHKMSAEYLMLQTEPKS